MYATCIQLARDNIPEICQAAAELIHPRNLKFYSHLSKDELAPQLATALQQHLQYLETGDIEAWRTFCIERMTLRAQENGADFSSVIEANGLILQALENFLKEKLGSQETVDGLATAKVLQRLSIRLNGLQSVAATTGTAVGLRLKNS
jgi:hypothetical protein